MAGMTTRIGWGIVLGTDGDGLGDEDNSLHELATDVDGWWLKKTNNYKPIENVYEPEGSRFPGVTEDEISAYFAHRREFMTYPALCIVSRKFSYKSV